MLKERQVTVPPVRSDPRPSQADLAYEAVRDLLIRLDIAPGAPIIEADLMERTGYGRTPLREALNRLESERLVNIFSRRGTFAADINLADLGLITDLRQELEGHAAARAAVRATRAERATLEAMLEAMVAVIDGDVEAQMEFDTLVHRAIYAAAHNHFLEETATRYHNLSMRIWRLFVDRLPDLRSHIDEHRALIHTIVAGNSEAAAQMARRHVRGFEKAVRALL